MGTTPSASRARRRAIAAIAIALAAIALAACGGDSGGAGGASVPGGADSADVEVIDAWSSELRHGDLNAAAGYFALPSVAENGVKVRIRDLEDARLFNASLPCGAVLERAEASGEATIATFRLTERPGPGSCGEGTGGIALTAFVIADGEIVEWRRVVPEGAERTPGRSF